MDKFFASFGDISTKTPWKRPTMMAVSDWYKEWIFTVGVEDYDVWLVGSFAERVFGVYPQFPNDVDIVLTGQIVNPKRLKYIMDEAMRIGFSKQIFVDVMWCSTLFPFDTDTFRPYSLVRNGKTFVKIIGEDVEQKNFYGDEEYSLSNGLTQFVYYNPPPNALKFKHRRDNGEYLGICQNLREFFE